MISTSESNDTAFAISTIWRLATVSVRTSASGSTSIDRRSNSAAVCRRSAAWSIRPKRFFGSRRIQMFSATVMYGIRLSSWWIIAMPRSSASSGPFSTTGSPFRRISPLSGV